MRHRSPDVLVEVNRISSKAKGAKVAPLAPTLLDSSAECGLGLDADTAREQGNTRRSLDRNRGSPGSPEDIARRCRQGLASCPQPSLKPPDGIAVAAANTSQGSQALSIGGLHDIQNLVSVVLASLQMLETEVSSVRGRELVKEANEAARLSSELATRFRSPDQLYRMQTVDPGVLLTDTLALLRLTLSSSIVLELDIGPEPEPVLTDPVGLRCALMNFVMNARDAMPRGGRLRIEVSNILDKAEVLLSVSDTGTGMSARVRRRAVEPFFTTKLGGSVRGLGLSQARHFAEQICGRLEIESARGLGTTIRLYLPMARSRGREQCPCGALAVPRQTSETSQEQSPA